MICPKKESVCSLESSPPHSAGKLIDLSTFEGKLHRPGSVESFRSSATDQSDGFFDLRAAQCSSSEETPLSNELRCLVCFDAANGSHYGVQSCNGCKTFFRRCIVAGRTFKCKADGRCFLDKDKRCACRACRYQKCVEVGMKADAIQYTPSANLTLSIVRKKFQRNGRNPNGLAVARGLSVEQDAVLQRIDEVLHLEEKQYRLRNSSFYDHDASIRLPDLLSRPSIMGEASKYSLVEKWPSRPSNVVLSFEDFRKFGIKFWFYADMYLSIEYMKTLPVFKHLCFDDQLAVCFTNVLKDSMLVASYYSFQKGVEDVIIYPDNWVAFQQHDVSSSLIEIEKEIRRGVVPEICLLRPDKIEFSLLRMIGALNYTCVDGLSEAAQERLEVDCSRYQSALLVYLQNKYGLNGTRRFAELLALLALVSQRIRFNHEYFALKQCILKIPSPSTLFVEIMSKQLVPIDA